MATSSLQKNDDLDMKRQNCIESNYRKNNTSSGRITIYMHTRDNTSAVFALLGDRATLFAVSFVLFVHRGDPPTPPVVPPPCPLSLGWIFYPSYFRHFLLIILLDATHGRCAMLSTHLLLLCQADK